MTKEILLDSPLTPDGPFPELTRRLRMGVVGGGRIAKVHRWAAALSERWDVVASTAIEYQKAGHDAVALAKAGIRVSPQERLYPDFREMAAAEAARPDGVDAVAICLPNHLHFEASRCFIEAGIAVLCEKPLVTHPQEGEALAGLAAEKKALTATSYPYSAYPMVRQARHLVASGAIGKVQQIYVEFTQDFLMTAAPAGQAGQTEWRLDPATSGMAGSTADVGTHALQMIEFVSGLRVQSVSANLTSCGPSKALDDTFHILLRCEDGVPGVMFGSQAAAGITTGPQFRVHGETGSLMWSNATPQELTCHAMEQPIKVYTRGGGRGIDISAERLNRRGRGNMEGWVEAFTNLYIEFAMAFGAHHDNAEVPDGLLGIADFAVGLRGVRFVEAAVKSAKADGKWTAL